MFKNVSDEWQAFLKNDTLTKIHNQIKNLEDITPPITEIFHFARFTKSPSDIRVVILGQDPYPQVGDACGLAFSCYTHIPASLRNIYSALVKSELLNKKPTMGDLSSWAKQGVLLLNCALTTITDTSNAHAKLWEPYTNDLITRLANLSIKEEKQIVFLLWGNYAKNKSKFIPKSEYVHQLTYAHPSPLAQKPDCKFADCDHFKLVNEILSEPIYWDSINDVEYKVKEVKVKDVKVKDIKEVKEQKQTIEEKVDPLLKTKLKFEMTDRKQVVFTDGSCNPNKLCPEAIAGYAAVFVLGTMKDVILYGNINNRPHYASNQRAEGFAILKTLEYLKAHIVDWDEVVIVTDSQFWISMFETYMPAWVRSNTDFEEKKNPDLTVKMWSTYSSLIAQQKEIEFRHIKSHGKNGWNNKPEDSYEFFCYYQNEYIDSLAGYARTNLKPGEDVVDKVTFD
jgi:uracil-DNA glycosylase